MTTALIIPTTARLTTTFTPIGSTVPADPTGVVVKWRDPGTGTVTIKTFGADPEVKKDAVGVYHVDIPCSSSGTWTCEWTGTGVVAVSSLKTWPVRVGL
jgi:hypothetical protein